MMRKSAIMIGGTGQIGRAMAKRGIREIVHDRDTSPNLHAARGAGDNGFPDLPDPMTEDQHTLLRAYRGQSRFHTISVANSAGLTGIGEGLDP